MSLVEVEDKMLEDLPVLESRTRSIAAIHGLESMMLQQYMLLKAQYQRIRRQCDNQQRRK